MKLRPHHLLCTQGYSGKGYSDEFVENMTALTARLRDGSDAVVEIVFSTDDLCSHCPHMLGEDLCDQQDKVKYFDAKVIAYFGVEETCYPYQEMVRTIHSKMTSAMMDDICGSCSWYPVSACKSKVLNR